jgi:hypothetical protein
MFEIQNLHQIQYFQLNLLHLDILSFHFIHNINLHSFIY